MNTRVQYTLVHYIHAMNTFRTNSAKIVIAFFVSALLLYVTFSSFDPRQIIPMLVSIQWQYLIYAILVFLGIDVALAFFRWSYQLHRFNALLEKGQSTLPITPLAVAPAILAGYFANNTMPARLGEVVKTLIWRKNSGMRGSSVLGTLVIERVFDGFALVTLAIMTYFFIFTGQQDHRFTIVIFVALFVFIAIFAVGLCTVFFPRHVRNLALYCVKFLPARFAKRLSSFILSFFEALTVVGDIKSVLILYGYSLLIWLAEAWVYYLVALAFSATTGLHLGYLHCVLLASIASLMTLIPSMPGFAGTFDLAVKLVLLRFGIQDQHAQAYTIMVHLVLWLPVTLVGAWFFVREGVAGMIQNNTKN